MDLSVCGQGSSQKGERSLDYHGKTTWDLPVLDPFESRTAVEFVFSSSYVLVCLNAREKTAVKLNLTYLQKYCLMPTKLPNNTEDWPRVFEQHLNAGDLDSVMELYDSEAHFATRSGETLVGVESIRKVLGSMIKARTQMHSRVVRAVTVGDVAQLYTDFEGTTVDNSGKTTQIHHQAIEVLRRQTDGGWKLIIGDPDGRG